MVTLDQIQQMADVIAREFEPEKIILFGSYARGDAHEDSDVDLIVVKSTDRDVRDVAAAIGARVWRVPVAKDILVRTPEQFERECAVCWTVFHKATQQGRVLFEHAG